MTELPLAEVTVRREGEEKRKEDRKECQGGTTHTYTHTHTHTHTPIDVSRNGCARPSHFPHENACQNRRRPGGISQGIMEPAQQTERGGEGEKD